MKPELKNLIDLVMKIGDWINTITNFSIVMNIAIVGWVYSTDKPWSEAQRIILIIGYLIFASYNTFSQYRSQCLLQVSLNEMKEMITKRGQLIEGEALAKDEKLLFYTPQFMAMLQGPKRLRIGLIVTGQIIVAVSVATLIGFAHR